MDRTYPTGVPCWVDLTVPDVDAALAFYGELFGWSFTDAMPPGAPGRYVIADLGGRDAAAIGGPGSGPASWSTYVAVEDCDEAASRLARVGAELVEAPEDAGPGGRAATLRDPEGAELRLWQARRRLGAQVVNEPGAWNFSDLRTAMPAPDGPVGRWYAAAFGWRLVDQGWATAVQVPGYGDHLEGTVDPDIRTRQAAAPEGFADVVGSLAPPRAELDEQPHWHVTFSVADRDASVETVERLGGEVRHAWEDDWVRAAVVRDPQGATLTVSQFAPRDWA